MKFKILLPIFIFIILDVSCEERHQNKVDIEVVGISDDSNVKINYPELVKNIQIGTPLCDYVSDITLDSEENIIISGYTQGFFEDPENSRNECEHFCDYDSFLMKLNKEGKRIWVKQWGDEKMQKSFGHSVDESDNIYVISSEYEESEEEQEDGYTTKRRKFVGKIIKYDKSGAILWKKDVDTDSKSMLLTEIYYKSGNFFIAGSFLKPEIPQPIDGRKVYIGNNIIIKYDVDGNEIWRKINEVGIWRAEMSHQIVTDEDDNVYVAGTDIDRGGNDGYHSGGVGPEYDFSSGFIYKYSKDGDLIWEKRHYDEKIPEYGSAFFTVAIQNNEISTSGFKFTESLDYIAILVENFDLDGNCNLKKRMELYRKNDLLGLGFTGRNLLTLKDGSLCLTAHIYRKAPDQNGGLALIRVNNDGTYDLLSEWGHKNSSSKTKIISSTFSESNIFVAGQNPGSFDGTVSYGGQDIFITIFEY